MLGETGADGQQSLLTANREQELLTPTAGEQHESSTASWGSAIEAEDMIDFDNPEWANVPPWLRKRIARVVALRLRQRQGR